MDPLQSYILDTKVFTKSSYLWDEILSPEIGTAKSLSLARFDKFESILYQDILVGTNNFGFWVIGRFNILGEISSSVVSLSFRCLISYIVLTQFLTT